jgi:hypothetical protein
LFDIDPQWFLKTCVTHPYAAERPFDAGAWHDVDERIVVLEQSFVRTYEKNDSYPAFRHRWKQPYV